MCWPGFVGRSWLVVVVLSGVFHRELVIEPDPHPVARAVLGFVVVAAVFLLLDWPSNET